MSGRTTLTIPAGLMAGFWPNLALAQPATRRRRRNLDCEPISFLNRDKRDHPERSCGIRWWSRQLLGMADLINGEELIGLDTGKCREAFRMRRQCLRYQWRERSRSSTGKGPGSGVGTKHAFV